ncbi:MAG TPA: transglutaminase family protein [Pirellulales bacterium]
MRNWLFGISAWLFLISAAISLSLFFGEILPAAAQFDAAPGTKVAQADNGPKLDQPTTQKVTLGVKIRAIGGPCRGIVASFPVPMEWPEQKVEAADKDFSPGVHLASERVLSGGAKQILINIPSLASGEEAHAIMTFEVTRSSILPPEETSLFKQAAKEKLPRDVASYLAPSPFIESTHPKITALAKEATEDKSDWEKVEAIYNTTREKIQYKNGPLKGALRGLIDGTGDCEELTSLFVALCRASNIPARTVWVTGHCYPEFYLVDDNGKGYWFPCQAAGSAAFGGIPEHRPILQKGDNFHDPDRPETKLRYVSQFLKGTPAAKGAGRPQVQWVEDWQ